MPKCFYHFRSALLLIAVTWCSASFAPDNEFQRRLNQARGDLAHPEVFSFLADVPERDLPLLIAPILTRSDNSWDDYRKATFRRAWRRYPLFAGAVGEIYLNSYMRDHVKQHPGLEFIDSESYDLANPDGTRPDGLLIRRTQDGVIIESALESKMGGARHYDPTQTFGFLRVWQIVGLTLPDGTVISPSQIKLRVGEGTEPLMAFNLSNRADLNRAEQVVTLVVPRGKAGEFPGKILEGPFNSAEVVELSQRYVAYAWLGGVANPSRVSAVIARERPPPSPPLNKTRRTFTEPTIRPRPWVPKSVEAFPEHILNPSQSDSVPPPTPSVNVARPQSRGPVPPRNFASDNALVQFIESRGEFPSQSTDADLARYLNKIGGRMFVFANLLDDVNRRKLAAAGKAPAIGPMEHWLSEVDPVADGDLAESVLRIYLRLYDKAENSRLVAGLQTRKDNWAEFFSVRPLASLRSGQCARDFEGLSDTP